MIDMEALAKETKIKKIPITAFNAMQSDSTHLLVEGPLPLSP